MIQFLIVAGLIASSSFAHAAGDEDRAYIDLTEPSDVVQPSDRGRDLLQEIDPRSLELMEESLDAEEERKTAREEEKRKAKEEERSKAEEKERRKAEEKAAKEARKEAEKEAKRIAEEE